MSYSDDHASDDLGDWQRDESSETYRCPSCGCVAQANVWSHWPLTLYVGPEDRADDETVCSECDAPLTWRDQVAGHGCGGCGHAVAETGSDYCAACNAEHDAAEAADPLHHHVWQSADQWQQMIRDITLAQAGAR